MQVDFAIDGGCGAETEGFGAEFEVWVQGEREQGLVEVRCGEGKVEV